MNREAPSAIKEHYDVETTVAGGHSIVYKARDKNLDRLVAIKTPDEKVRADTTRLEKFIDEGRKLARLDDPYVLSVYHFYEQGEVDQGCYLITPWMDQSLQDVLEREDLKPESAIGILRKILLGMSALHQAGIIHRDLKPGNIYLSANGQQVKVGDLGIASDVGVDQTLSAADLTPKYHAPELFGLEGKIDRRFDIYSLGMMAYEMLVGKSKFEEIFSEIYKGTDEKSRSTRWLNWHQDPARVAPPLAEIAPDVPPHVSDCVARMLDKDPNSRFPDVDSVLVALDAGAAPHAAEPPFPFDVLEVDEKGGKTSKGKPGLLRSKWTWIGTSIVLFWVVLFIAVFSGPSGNRDEAVKARSAMEAARKKATDIGAGTGEGKIAFDTGEEGRNLGGKLEKKNYDKARDAYNEAAANYGKSVVLVLTARARHSRELAVEARKEAERFDAVKLESFGAAQQILEAAESLEKEEKFNEAVDKYVESEQGFKGVVEEARAIHAWMKTDAARKAALDSGIPADDGLYIIARGVHKSGADSLKQEDFTSAEKYFDQATEAYTAARSAYEKILARKLEQPISYTAGSTPAQLLDAIELCMAYQSTCDPEWYASETLRPVELTPFMMDPYEVTTREFARFIEDTGYETEAEKLGYSMAVIGLGSLPMPGLSWRTPAGARSSYKAYLDNPVVHVTLADATEFCRWAGKRLPSEEEWEFMARGLDNRVFPWGNEWNSGNLVWKSDGITSQQKTGSRKQGATPAGIHDLAGNVWEWTSTRQGASAILKGGSWTDNNPANFRSAARRTERPQSSSSDDGFRCIEDVPEWRSERY